MMLASAAYARIETYKSFLSEEDVAYYAKAGKNEALRDQDPHHKATNRKVYLSKVPRELHQSLRRFLLTEEQREWNNEDLIELVSDVEITTIYGSSHPHVDRYKDGSDIIVNGKTGFVYLEDKPDVVFHQGDEWTTAEKGKLVIFDASIEHYSDIPEGDSVQMLGPFIIDYHKLGRKLYATPFYCADGEDEDEDDCVDDGSDRCIAIVKERPAGSRGKSGAKPCVILCMLESEYDALKNGNPHASDYYEEDNNMCDDPPACVNVHAYCP
ncbi:hypothetical protein ACA910_007518 [Epithemia clementina (nom. ined.)]